MTYNITIKIKAQDVSDIKMHMQIVRQSLLQAIKANPEEPERKHYLDGMGSEHELTIDIE